MTEFSGRRGPMGAPQPGRQPSTPLHLGGLPHFSARHLKPQRTPFTGQAEGAGRWTNLISNLKYVINLSDRDDQTAILRGLIWVSGGGGAAGGKGLPEGAKQSFPEALRP